jgi:phage shock protein A
MTTRESDRAQIRPQRQHERVLVRYYSLPDKIRALECQRDSLERDVAMALSPGDAALIRAGIRRRNRRLD